jgi:hypothetical protein
LQETWRKKGLEAVPELLCILINTGIHAERTKYLQVEECEQTADRIGHANGYKPKTVRTRIGDIIFARLIYKLSQLPLPLLSQLSSLPCCILSYKNCTLSVGCVQLLGCSSQTHIFLIGIRSGLILFEDPLSGEGEDDPAVAVDVADVAVAVYDGELLLAGQASV